MIIEQEASDAKYKALKDNPEAAKAVEDEVTANALALSKKMFEHFKSYEADMHARLVEAGRKDDPYRASMPDNYKDPEPENQFNLKKPVQPEKTQPIQTKVNEEGNPNNRFGYAATKDKESYVSTKVETFVKPEVKAQDPSEAVSAGNGGNENNRFGSSFAKATVETFPNTNYSYNVHP